MEPVMAAEGAVTAGRPVTAGGQLEEDKLILRKGGGGGPMLLWHVPGDKSDV